MGSRANSLNQEEVASSAREVLFNVWKPQEKEDAFSATTKAWMENVSGAQAPFKLWASSTINKFINYVSSRSEVLLPVPAYMGGVHSLNEQELLSCLGVDPNHGTVGSGRFKSARIILVVVKGQLTFQNEKKLQVGQAKSCPLEKMGSFTCEAKSCILPLILVEGMDHATLGEIYANCMFVKISRSGKYEAAKEMSIGKEIYRRQFRDALVYMKKHHLSLRHNVSLIAGRPLLASSNEWKHFPELSNTTKLNGDSYSRLVAQFFQCNLDLPSNMKDCLEVEAERQNEGRPTSGPAEELIESPQCPIDLPDEESVKEGKIDIYSSSLYC